MRNTHVTGPRDRDRGRKTPKTDYTLRTVRRTHGKKIKRHDLKGS